MSKYYCKKCLNWHSEGYKKHWQYKDRTKKKQPESLKDCTKQDLLKRIEEVMTRITGKIPDALMTDSWDWNTYLAWITEPFFYVIYEEYDDRREI